MPEPWLASAKDLEPGLVPRPKKAPVMNAPFSPKPSRCLDRRDAEQSKRRRRRSGPRRRPQFSRSVNERREPNRTKDGRDHQQSARGAERGRDIEPKSTNAQPSPVTAKGRPTIARLRSARNIRLVAACSSVTTEEDLEITHSFGLQCPPGGMCLPKLFALGPVFCYWFWPALTERALREKLQNAWKSSAS